MKIARRWPVWIAISSATVLAAAAGGFHLYMRFDHNAQGEMYNLDGSVDYFYAVELFLLPFIPVWIVAGFSVWGIGRALQKFVGRIS